MVKAETLNELEYELDKACGKFGNEFNNMHEAYAVIKEEVDEFWDEVKKKQQNPHLMKGELLQVAAMAIKAYQQL